MPQSLDDLWNASPSAAPAPVAKAKPNLDQLWSASSPAADAGTPKATPGSAITYGIANAVPFSHDIGAAIQAGETYLPKWAQTDDIGNPVDSGTSFSDRFSQQKARINATDAANRAAYPKTSMALPVLTSMAALPVAGPVDALSAGIARGVPSLAGGAADSLASGALGAGYGAAYGAGTGDTLADRASNAAWGATFGGAGGAAAVPIAKAVGNIGSAVRDKFLTSAPTAATKRIAEAIGADQAAGRAAMTPADFAAAQAQGHPVAVADLGGPNTQRLAQSAVNMSPDAGSALNSMIDKRFSDPTTGQASQVEDFFQNLHGSVLNAQDARDANVAAAAALNRPNYAAAYKAGANGIWNPQLEAMIQSPSVQKAVRQASSIAQDDAVATGSPPVKNPFVNDAQGNLTLAKNPNGTTAIPSLEFWDYVKRGLDDQIESAYGANQKSQAGRLTNLKSGLLSQLDSAVPQYAKARAGAQGMFGTDNALIQGEKSLQPTSTANTAAMASHYQKLTPPQQEMYARGQASQIIQMAKNAKNNRNVFDMYNSPAMANVINMGQGAKAPQVEAFFRAQNAMDALRKGIRGQSSTARQLADINKPGEGPIKGVLRDAFGTPIAGALAGGYGAYEKEGEFNPLHIGAGALGGAFAGLMLHHMTSLNANTMREIGMQLASGDASKVNAAVQTMSKSPQMMNALRSIAKRGAISPTVMRAQSQSSQQHPSPAYAKGGAVAKPSHADLVKRLMDRVEAAKRAEKAATKPILNVPDNAVVRALDAAKRAI